MSKRVGAAAAIVVSILIVLNLLARSLDESVGGAQPRGRPGSSYATTRQGLAAYESLLAKYGHPIEHQRGSLTDTQLPADRTIVVIDPQQLDDLDTGALLQFVTNGGRLVIGGSVPSYLRRLRDDPPQWSPVAPQQYDRLDSELGAARRVETVGNGVWSDTRGRRELVTSESGALVAEEQVGRGSIVYVADPSFMENGLLDRADNAAVALSLVGPERRRVVFAEGVHGYARQSGLRAIPTRWKIAFLAIMLAAIAFVWTRGRRLGPPDRQSRELPPPRALYVDALARSLEQTGDRARAVEPLRVATRERVASRAGIAHDPNDEELDRAARSLGLEDAERTALGVVHDDDAVLALGRASARVASNDLALGDWRVE